MILNIELPDELGTLLRKDAEAQGMEPDVLLVHYMADIYDYTQAEENGSAAKAEIEAAVNEFEAMKASGESGILASVVHEDLRMALSEQRKKAA